MRLIDANAFVREIVKLDDLRRLSTKTIGEALDRCPAIDAAPVVHGRWKSIVIDPRHQITCDECSACGFKYGGLGIEAFLYCPNCGAKMDGGASNA